MALKMLYRGPSSRLETLIEKIQSSKEAGNDLYSTHTSSSYSPSTSEGPLTPNSLLHHHQHLSHHPQENRDINRLRANSHEQRHRRRFRASVTANGSCDRRTDDAHDDDDADADSHGDDDEDDTQATEGAEVDDNNDDDDDGGDDTNEPHAELGGDISGKMPGKLRKIEREALKSEKLTGEGIKGSADGSYQCQFCDKSFPRLGYLKKHEQSHAEHLPFKCEYCARLFKHKRSRDRHTKLHTGDRRYRCPHCEAAFSRSDHLKIHMKTHDTQKPFQCTVCNRGYNTAAALTSHMQNHKKQAALLGTGQTLNYSPRSTGSGSSSGSFHKRRYAMTDCSPRPDYRKHSRISSFIACIYCTKSDFTTLEQLNAHIQSMHDQSTTTKDVILPTCPPTSSVFQLSCEYCTMKFPNIPTMFQHMRTTHIDRLTSPNSYFEHFNRLAASGTFSPRLLTNTSLRTYNSDVDTKVKIEQPSPNQERRSQGDGEKDDEQTSPTDLSQPKKRQSPQQDEQSRNERNATGAFLCNQCNAALPDFDTFRIHLKSHITQETASLVCPHCGLNLRDSAEQERHIIGHFLITNTEFSCSNANCKKTFAKPDELQKHLFDSHIQVMYKCSICSDMFDTKVAIQVHFACTHSNESKVFRCSACMESFSSEKEFSGHVRARHSNSSSAIQCIFCRAVCSSELEMHFHLAAHARQFRCPACPETFHVEFLLDRHMQTHHSQKDTTPVANTTGRPPSNTPGTATSDPLTMNSYQGAFNKQPLIPNNNNNILDYNAFAASKSLLQFPGRKFYSPLQVDTTAVGSLAKHSALMYGLSQRYFDANKTLMDIYNYNQENKTVSPYFINPGSFDTSRNASSAIKSHQPAENKPPAGERANTAGFSCGICERSDFRTESDVHSHRKIVHNLKTGVSLRCAYCNGNFKSRSELEHHMKTCHNSTGKHKCLICDEIFPSPAVLAEHKLQHSKVGQSGKCSHCSVALNDVAMFKSHLNEHNPEGQIPVQCICCRQTLHSDFEVGLHAKFHTKSTSSPENMCALCLETLPPTTESRVCEKCCRKHNLNSKFNMRNFDMNGTRNYVENRCNLCKMILPHAQRLQEHLVEHTFVGCEERGYSCYICSAVFTVPAGLLSHMLDHGLHARPYDCNLCSEKYFFRAELDNHLIEHEILGRNGSIPENGTLNASGNTIKSELSADGGKDMDGSEKAHQLIGESSNPKGEVKSEAVEDCEGKVNAHDDDDEEYIEVEKIADTSGNAKTQNSDA